MIFVPGTSANPARAALPVSPEVAVRITMPSRKIVDVNSLQTVKKPRGEDSKAILEGHATNGQPMEQWVRLEQLTDTSYIFAIALASKPQSPTYPAGRGLLFLDIADRRILRAKCVADSYPVVGTGETPDLDMIIHGDGGVPTTSGDLQFRANQTTGHSPKCWQVPCFEISDKGLETLLDITLVFHELLLLFLNVLLYLLPLVLQTLHGDDRLLGLGRLLSFLSTPRFLVTLSFLDSSSLGGGRLPLHRRIFLLLGRNNHHHAQTEQQGEQTIHL